MTEQQIFADSVAQHVPFLSRVVRRVTRSDYMAEDIVQQTILKALTNAHQFRFESALKTWLVSIAVNEARQAYRDLSRRRAVPLMTETPHVDACQQLEFPDNVYEAKERDLLVRDAVSRLPPRYRSVIELCDFQGVSMTEAACKLGLTLPAIKSRRHRARHKLRPIVETLKRS
jgi:RNA polymerase sigma-70 factor (ECF subfamily)